jgi:hypothetical protein
MDVNSGWIFQRKREASKIFFGTGLEQLRLTGTPSNSSKQILL